MTGSWKKRGWIMPPDRFIVGLTGGAACGKSAVLKAFADFGAETISADALVAGLLEKNGKGYAALIKNFGCGILAGDGNIDKKAFAERIFRNPAGRIRLEKILHPMVMTEAGELIKKSKKNIIVFEVPLLFEAGLGDWFDVIAAVYAADKKCAGRAAGRGWTKAEFARRSLAQLPAQEKCRLADIVIDNNKTMAEMRKGVGVLFRNLQKITRSR